MHNIRHTANIIILFIIIATISFLGGILVSMIISGLNRSKPIIPKAYQGYYLTQIYTKTNEYDHIIHITSNSIESTNGTNQLQNAGSYDANPSDVAYSNIRFKFNVHSVRLVRNKGISLIGNVSKQTTPQSHFDKIKGHHELPPLVVLGHRLIFTSLRPKGILQEIRLKNGVVATNNIRITSHLANTIKNSDANNTSAFHSINRDN